MQEKERKSKPASVWIHENRAAPAMCRTSSVGRRPWPTAVSAHVAPPHETRATRVVQSEEPCHGAMPCGVGEKAGATGAGAATQ